MNIIFKKTESRGREMIEANSKLDNAVLIAKIAYVHFFQPPFISQRREGGSFSERKMFFCAEIFFTINTFKFPRNMHFIKKVYLRQRRMFCMHLSAI